MALELHMALEAALGVQIAVVGAGDRNLAAMAQTIVGQMLKGEDQQGATPADALPAPVVALAGVHSTTELSPDEANRLLEAVRSSYRGAA